MKTILVTGSRVWFDYQAIEEFLLNLPPQTTIIHGGAQGVDSITERKCKALGIPTKIFLPVNKKISAYYLHRNAEMIGVCDEVVAFWDGSSRGTNFTIKYAEARNKKVTIHQEKEEEK